MENLPFLLRPQALFPSLPLATPLNSSTQRSGRLVVPIPRRRRPNSATLAVADETPRTKESWSSPDDEHQFDWLDQWYPFAPVCDLDPGAPHGKMVLGLNVVAWYDRRGAGGEWRVFDDACPHRLAPLSEGRIDDKGRLQCVYHGWCFDVPELASSSPRLRHSGLRKACVASYPCVVQNKILWFYPRTEPEYKDVLQRKRPPYIPEIDDPSYFTVFGVRDFYYGYDILVENLMDPAHASYAHKGMLFSAGNGEDPGRYVVPDLTA
ncbi:hypothetical protein PR202_gb10569 [Eleusine coracana subsp. coracana]|uniref:Rieske domain-containing protein n=1 Tax=Eleusine coracana subsp. coracana TaxID=191504 RepID=A0AAV5EIB6_ELECO|nr:hypothetical protein PR202_gb10569 [Eleusine coracana subsp. coracana]